jgi:hypothetical protein
MISDPKLALRVSNFCTQETVDKNIFNKIRNGDLPKTEQTGLTYLNRFLF